MQLKNNLYTPRITVRDYRKSDLPFLIDMWFDEENGKYLSDPAKAYVDDEYRKALDQLEDNPYGYYLTLVLNGSDEIMGSCFIFPDDKQESYDIAYCIHKNYWGQGYGTELIRLIIDWVYNHGGIEITAEVAKDNTASNLLLRKNGFEVIRENRFRKYNMDVYYDSYIYRLMLKHPPVMEISLFSDKYKVRTLTYENIDEIYQLLSKNVLYYEYCPSFVTRQGILDDMNTLPPGKTIRDKYYTGFYQEDKLAAVMDFIDGYPEKGIAYIGFFMTDVSMQNSGRTFLAKKLL